MRAPKKITREKITVKNYKKEIELISHRIFLITCIIACLIFFLIGRLAYLQVYKHHQYDTLSDKNWLDFVPVVPTRGLIYDRHGVLLAKNVPVFSLDLIPEKIKNLPATLAALQKIMPITNDNLQQFHKQLRLKRPFEPIPLKIRLSEQEVAQFSVNQFQFPGAMIHSRLIREYPLGNTFSHVIGYVGQINAEDLTETDTTNYRGTTHLGKIGIEKQYEMKLHGQTGFAKVEKDASGKPLRHLTKLPAQPGYDLYLTIDSRLQTLIEQALGPLRGAVVAIQPATGQVLAMVSTPNYNPNLFVIGMTHALFHDLQDTKNKPLYNRALRGVYSPGSTVKPFLGLAGLESQVIHPNDTIYDTEEYRIPHSAHVFHDWDTHSHGTVNLDRAITVSCDIYFYQLAEKLGIQRMVNFLAHFGFGELTGIDTGDEISGVLPSPTWKMQARGIAWYPGDTINAGIGQGYFQVTPLQLAFATTILANRGDIYKPYLVLKEEQPGKETIHHVPTMLGKIELTHAQDWDTVITGMQHVIRSPDGTGFRFGKNPPYSAAAKTGSAQVYSGRYHHSNIIIPERLQDNSLFIVFAPVENPEIAVAVVIENSNQAGVIARKAVDFYLENKV